MRTANVTLLVLSLATLTAACAGRESAPAPLPAASPALDVAGLYDFTATFNGQTRTGTLFIERTSEGHSGEARLQGESDPAVIDSVSVEGNTAVILANVSGQEIAFELDFTGDDFVGFIFADTEAIEVTGRRRAAQE